jgi:type I restriction enzyme M protein
LPANRQVFTTCYRAYDCENSSTAQRATSTSSGLRDESHEESDNLPDPDVLAQEIVEDLEAAIEQFPEIAADLGGAEIDSENS